jgi:HipA-like C-terminal domain
MKTSSVKAATVRKLSGKGPSLYRFVPALKKRNYRTSSITISGEAPKDFICVYEYGICRRDRPRTWTQYIAKVGHKWYPVESITEQLMNRIGSVMGLRVAESKLMFVGGQLRFLSKYFLRPGQRLFHGAEIFSAYLNDQQFVESVANQKVEQDYFTYQFAQAALTDVFSQAYPAILQSFIGMLVFDAVVGNFDRHMYNWGVIIDTRTQQPLGFSPIYDTARGFFWNRDETQLKRFYDYGQMSDQVQNYIRKSKPKIAWEGQPDLNHIDLIGVLYRHQPDQQAYIRSLVTTENRERVLKLIDNEFGCILTGLRLIFIKETVTSRFNQLIDRLKP